MNSTDSFQSKNRKIRICFQTKFLQIKSLFQTLKHFNFSILLNLNSLITQVIFNYISCSYANNVTVRSLSAAEIAYSMPWYGFPVSRQLFIKHMIRRAQKPFYLKGYDIVECSLTTFFNVNLY